MHRSMVRKLQSPDRSLDVLEPGSGHRIETLFNYSSFMTFIIVKNDYRSKNDSHAGIDGPIENIIAFRRGDGVKGRQGAKTYLVTCKAVSLINISRCITYSISEITQSRLRFAFQRLLFHLNYRRMVRQKPWTYRSLSREPRGAVAT